MRSVKVGRAVPMENHHGKCKDVEVTSSRSGKSTLEPYSPEYLGPTVGNVKILFYAPQYRSICGTAYYSGSEGPSATPTSETPLVEHLVMAVNFGAHYKGRTVHNGRGRLHATVGRFSSLLQGKSACGLSIAPIPVHAINNSPQIVARARSPE